MKILDSRPVEDGSGVTHYLAGVVELMTELHNSTKQLVSRYAVPVRGAESRPFLGNNGKLWTSPVRLAGYSFRETSGTAGATLRFHDGTGTDGELMVTIALAQGTSTPPAFFGDDIHGGLAFTQGLFVELVSGAVEGAVWGWANVNPR